MINFQFKRSLRWSMDDSLFRLRMLGHLEVHRDGRIVGPGTNALKPRELLLVLAVDANRVVSKDALVDRLWEAAPPTARNLIEKYVAVWRKALGNVRLETVGHGYRLNLAADECDLLEAQRCIARGRAAAQTMDWTAAAAALTDGLGLWSPGFAGEAAALLPEPEVRRLVDLHTVTVEEWALAVLRVGEPRHELVDVLQDTLARSPLREPLAEYLMWALAAGGHQQAAVACYERIRRGLAEELGQDPGETLRAMHVRVLRQDRTLRLSPSSVAVAQNLPPRNGRFVGRERELSMVENGMRPPSGGRVRGRVAMWGLVGVGKSAIALEYAHRHGHRYQYVWWIDASTSATTAAGLEELATRLGFLLPADRETNLDQLWLRLGRFDASLLIFDNADSAAAMRDYLPDSAAIDVLVTSLNPDWRQLTEVVAVDMLSVSDSAELLRARLSEPDTDVEMEVELITALGRLPLAISQAAAYIGQTGMRPSQYLQLFRRRRAQLLQRGVPDDHRGTIETTWRLAQAELSASHPAAVQLLSLCALLAPDNIPVELLTGKPEFLPIDLASAVRDELGFEDSIQNLRRYSLMSRDGDRLHVHCLVQAVVASSMADTEVEQWRHRASMALQAAAPDEVSPRALWSRWDSLIPHIREIARSAAAGSWADPGFIALTQLASSYLSTRAEYSDALDLMRDSHALTTASAEQPDDVAVGRSLTLLGSALEQSGQLKEALGAQERALEILQEHCPPDDPWVARALGGLGSVLTCHSGVSLWQPSELQEAESRFVHALTVLNAALGDQSLVVARLHSALGQVQQDRGDLSRGQVSQERALEMLETLLDPDHPDIGHCCDKLAYVLALRGDAERSLRLYERAATVLSRAYHSEHVWVAWSLSNRAMLLLSLGRGHDALEDQMRAHRIFTTGNLDNETAAQISAWRLARIYAAIGRRSEALDLLGPALDAATRLLGHQHGDVIAMTDDLRVVLAEENMPDTVATAH